MYAIQAASFGGPEVLELVELPLPEPAPGEIRVRVEAASINFADIMRRRDDAYPFPTPLPFIPGGEVAGTVDALGEGVEGPPIGAPVFALVGADGSTGYAQYVVAASQRVIPIPPGVSTHEAAAIAVAGTTAMLVLGDVAGLRAGETVVVEAAAGGVGGYAVQIAKARGATVIAAAGSEDGRNAALGLGADHAVDYSRPGWGEVVRRLTDGTGADVVLEMTGGDVFTEALSCLAPFGRFVVYGVASGEPGRLTDEEQQRLLYTPALNQSIRVFNLGLYFGLRPEPAVQALGELVGMVAAGQVEVPIGEVFPLASAAEAHRLIEARQTTGKVILEPWS